MITEAHRLLARRFNKPPTPIKVLENDLLLEILELLYTEEEALIVSNIQLVKATAEKVAKKMNRPASEIEPVLESLADRGLVFSYGKGLDKKYFVFPIFPGVFELQMWKSPDGEKTTRLAKLYDEYYNQEFSDNMLMKPSRVFRIIPVQESISDVKTGVLPADSIREVIDRHDAWSLANWCACRRKKSLVGDDCGKPKDVCMQFGPVARYIDQKGFGRLVSKPEILDAVNRAEEAGLIHFTDNIETPYIACNCCACCCVSLATLTRFNTPAMFTESRFMPVHDPGKCSACGVCATYCISGASHIYNEKYMFEPWKCIGCGNCVAKCNAGALKLKPRPEITVPENYGQMFMAIGNDYMELEGEKKQKMLKYNKSIGNFMNRFLSKLA